MGQRIQTDFKTTSSRQQQTSSFLTLQYAITLITPYVQLIS